MTVNENHWLSMKIIDCKWKTLAVNNKCIGSQWKSLTANEKHWPVPFSRFSDFVVFARSFFMILSINVHIWTLHFHYQVRSNQHVACYIWNMDNILPHWFWASSDPLFRASFISKDFSSPKIIQLTTNSFLSTQLPTSLISK